MKSSDTFDPKSLKKIYFVGIGGTGMASAAGLCKEAGYEISGSDSGLYPPMSTMLEELKIPVATPYSPTNIEGSKADLYIIANALSKGHPELEAVLGSGQPYTSFPDLLGQLFLNDRQALVVSGTHGKTTTTSLLSHVLNELGGDPSFLIGGIPRNFPYSFRLGKGRHFAIEGDEYDTAFFDKGPKFLHYRPKYLLINNLEFDHADIYKDLDAIEQQFAKLINLVSEKSKIIVNMSDPGLADFLRRFGSSESFTAVQTSQSEGTSSGATSGTRQAAVDLQDFKALENGKWLATFNTEAFGKLTIETPLTGRYNLANIAQVLGCIGAMKDHGDLSRDVDPEQLVAAFGSFKNVARRLDHLASVGGIDIYEDFAHHPTAVAHVLAGCRTSWPDKRLIVAFEPRSATQRRNVFQARYGEVFKAADRVYIGPSPLDERIPANERMNTADLAVTIGNGATAYDDNEALLQGMKRELKPGDAVIFMSSGSFSGTQHRLASTLQTTN